jgi:hypothetical protein
MTRVLAMMMAAACSHGTAAAGPNYRVDPPAKLACTANATCEAKLVVTALGDFHLNDKYPFKFDPDARPGIAIESATFSRDAATTGTMTIRFRTDKPGVEKLAGTLRLCVCTDNTCDVETPRIAVDVSSV